jgi:hypothetical protein
MTQCRVSLLFRRQSPGALRPTDVRDRQLALFFIDGTHKSVLQGVDHAE